MIIGEQRVNDTNYYDGSHQQAPPQNATHYEVLKRKLSNENEGECKSLMSEKSCSANKMQFIENIVTENYHTYQGEEIQQDGDQSYINLTVLTPSMVHYNDKHTITIHQPVDQQQNFIIHNQPQHQHVVVQQQQQQHVKQHVTSTTSTNSVGRNFHHQPHQSDNGEDNEDKNLSWLFNFKLDEIANLSPEIKRKRTNNNTSSSHHHNNSNQHSHTENHNYYNNNSASQQQQHFEENQPQRSKDPCIEDDLNVAENIVISNTPTSTTTHTPKKPPFTYTELIEYALEDKGELTVSGIYQWISDRFPYYKSNDDRWKNSVRHNLSINPHFRKGNKAKAGAGHLWKISSRESEANFLAWEHKKQRLELFFKMEAANNLKNQNANRSKESTIEINLNKHAENMSSPTYDAELNAATASIISLPIDTNSPLITTHGDPDSPISGQLYLQEVLPISTNQQQQQPDDLRRTANEILNGVRRNVEVQIMHPNDLQTFSILNTEDYLNPISKEEIMQESGLGRRHDEFYLIDPGITSVNGTDESTEVFEIFHEDFNLSYFGNNCIA